MFFLLVQIFSFEVHALLSMQSVVIKKLREGRGKGEKGDEEWN